MTTPTPTPNYVVEPLTPGESRIIYALINFELDYSEIAQELGVTKAAVMFHVVNIFSKLGVESRFAAVCKYAKLSRPFRREFIRSLSGNI